MVTMVYILLDDLVVQLVSCARVDDAVSGGLWRGFACNMLLFSILWTTWQRSLCPALRSMSRGERGSTGDPDSN